MFDDPADRQYDYPDAGRKAPPEVKLAILRFRTIVPESVRQRVPLLYWLLGSGTPPYKMSKQDSLYGPAPLSRADESCGNCRFAWQKVVRRDRHICSQINGPIELRLWCKLWQGAPDR